MQRSRLLIALLLCVALVGLQAPAAAFASCLVTPAPSPTPQPTYHGNVLGTQSAHLLAYWPLAEASGSTAADISGSGRNGTYSGATLNATTFLDGNPAPSFDGINDYVDVYSTSFAAAFNGAEGSALAWQKVSSSSVYTDGTARRSFSFAASAANRVLAGRPTTDNTIIGFYAAGGVNKQVSLGSFTDTNWVQVVVTWSHSADQMKFYEDGAQVGTTMTGLGTWAGSLDPIRNVIGANTTNGDQGWPGYIANVAVWDTILTSGEISALYSVPTVVPTETPVPTCTLTPTNTPTPTPTWTPTNTPTPTLTPTNTPTADLYTYITVIPPGGTVSDSHPAALVYQATAGQILIALLLSALLLLALFEKMLRARGRK